MKPQLKWADFEAAASELEVPVAAVMAVSEVEAPQGGFDAAGQPRILFEGHVFHRLTGGRFSARHPTISYRSWTRAHYAKGKDSDARNTGEHKRLGAATALARSAGLMSASWGKFQILGENYATAGFGTLQAFINAMYRGEGDQLKAFTQFVVYDRKGKLHRALRDAVTSGDWAPFASIYNGPAYAQNGYHTKLAAAFRKRS